MKWYVLCGQLRWIGHAQDQLAAAFKALAAKSFDCVLSPMVFVSEHGFDLNRTEPYDFMVETETLLNAMEQE